MRVEARGTSVRDERSGAVVNRIPRTCCSRTPPATSRRAPQGHNVWHEARAALPLCSSQAGAWMPGLKDRSTVADVNGNGRAPNMVDVAREAGVAHVTVSRVLNGHESVRPETRRRVEQAIAKLGYRRNDFARALKSGRTKALGVIVAGSSLHALPSVLLGMEKAANVTGHSITLASWHAGSDHLLDETIGRLLGQGIEGLVIVADRPGVVDPLERLSPHVPTSVVMSGGVENPAIASVEFDQVQGSRHATEYLLNLGHETVAHLSGRRGTFDGAARVRGWREMMKEAGVEAPLLFEGDFTARAGHELGVRLLAEPSRPTSLFVGNDLMAMGLMAAFADRGVLVPEHVSVVGFDDMAGAEYVGPGLTTIRQDFESLGTRSIEVVAGILEGESPRHHLLPTELVVRRSAARPSPARSSGGNVAPGM